ncbi:hypothetical protein Fmac_007611 [Flemingia macrophylla]|uniref:Endoglucanase n=1 Tax=Flemingia macrophylla TaxID=520843 RepID=A0ABD1MV17_9FABA
MPPTVSSTFESERHPVRYVHAVSETGRLLPSASRWNSIALDFKLTPNSSTVYESIPSQYPKSVDYNLVITDRKHFHCFIIVLVTIIFAILASVLLVHFLPQKHKQEESSIDLKLAINQALTFYDAQKSGRYPRNSSVKFRGDSGLQDGNSAKADLTGGFYDSGNNIKFTFTTAYTMTLLSWTVVEYHSKYADIGELDHVRDIIRWGSDYLLKVGSTISDNNEANDVSCWQRPEDMTYERPVSICDGSASDLAGEIVAALSAASMVFKEDKHYSGRLVHAAESLYEATINEKSTKQGTYTMVDACGKQSRMLYNSTSYKDELAWGATWLFLATENTDYLKNAIALFSSAKRDEPSVDNGIVSWNDKLNAVEVNYLLGQNPMKMSYLVGYGDKFPVQVHHRSASIPWNNQHLNCEDGKKWLNSKDPNPQVLVGAMVGGPDTNDKFMDQRTNQKFTEPNIASNAGLVAALIALQDPPSNSRDFKNSLWGWT